MSASPATEPATTDARGLRGFVRRNRDDLWLELIGGVILALVVSLVMFAIDQASSDSREAHAESLSNSIFVREAVMGGNDLLPFSALNLQGAQLSGLELAGADFSDADLRDAELKRSDLTGANLVEADLAGADLAGAVLAGADLTEARMDGTEVSGVDFTGATLTDADLTLAFYVAGEPPVGLADIGLLRVAPASDTDD
ncbi:pentapeptide repeat-containing protein [Microbacter sp. GSS18]|nr:pentapeptide repeat-containing protein [Microbacter sp. GSS18]